MSLESAHARQTDSPPSSGRSSPVPRATRRTVEDGLYRADKSLKRYAANIERALASWEIAPEEWADYIAFLGRLLKAIQTHPKDAPILPHSNAIATRLAQCLNPALPSGVHQKALDVYNYVFTTFGNDHIASHLHEYLPGLAAVLSFASLSVRPRLYSLFEEHVIALSPSDLRSALKSIILGLLPALEEETSEDFERAFSILQALESRFTPSADPNHSVTEEDGYFWQCLFLAVITSPSRRQGALSYLTRKLPRLVATTKTSHSDGQLSIPAQCVVSPEPGLLLRCFVCGLSDSQVLVQRGFLDLLVAHIPLDSPVLQDKTSDADLDRLVSAAMQVLLRRDMSLNRRLWTWFLGPELKGKEAQHTPTSPTSHRKGALDDRPSVQLRFFSMYGKASLQRCILKMLHTPARSTGQKARPFRVCLSLMDRWEIGGLLVPDIFLPAMSSLYEYSLSASVEDLAEVVRSANLFFDGIEASLIWESLIDVLRSAFEKTGTAPQALEQVTWITRTFNIKDEEMTTTHIPYAILYILNNVSSSTMSPECVLQAITLAAYLTDHVPASVFDGKKSSNAGGSSAAAGPSMPMEEVSNSILGFYKSDQRTSPEFARIFQPDALSELLRGISVSILETAAESTNVELFSKTTGILLSFLSRGACLSSSSTLKIRKTLEISCGACQGSGQIVPFPMLSCCVSLMAALAHAKSSDRHEILENVGPALMSQIWKSMSPEIPKHHVEAVKVFWQLEELFETEDMAISILNNLIRGERNGAQDLPTSTRRFSVLWNHSIPIGGSKLGLNRRGSGMSVLADAKQQGRSQRILESSSLLLLDILNTPSDPAFEVVKSWLQGLSSLDQIFHMLFSQLDRATADAMREDNSGRVGNRRLNEHFASLEYVLVHIENIVQASNDWTWQCLIRSGGLISETEEGRSGMLFLADICIRLLCNLEHASQPLNRRLISVLSALLSGPAAVELKLLELDSILIMRLMGHISNGAGSLQGDMLRLIQLALKLRTTISPPGSSTRPRTRGASISARRTSLAFDSRPGTSASSTSPASTPPPQLFRCLQLGFSLPSTHHYLDQWLVFLADVLPTISDTIFSNLLPLVECFSNQLSMVHAQMATLSRKVASKQAVAAPEAVAMCLLEGLEMVLDRAYECLMNDAAAESATKESDAKPSFLGNAMSGVFKADGVPGKSTKSNNRLTVILALQDSIRVTLRMWLWASGSSNFIDLDSTSSATTTYNALRVRNKTRHLLEQIFSVEPLESLEVIVAHWCNAPSDREASSTISLLHVMQVSRPKNVVPATLDALCSRTNPSAAVMTRNSSLTMDLRPSEVATFFSAYLDSTEDDAMDEVWPDCVAFLRDVLANPLPHRQVLPHLLSIIVLLAEKLNNTNFGEQRKMRRDLGDIFQRLLTATFTTLPSGYVAELAQEEVLSSDGPTRHAKNERSMTLVPVLKRVVAKLDLILESSDRMGVAVNNITNSLLATTFKARSFPKNVNEDLLELIVLMTRKAPTAKPWRKEVGDAFNDAKLLASSEELVVHGWFPVLHQWSLYDKERMPELISRLAPPSTAGIMFGVGASAARLEADRRTQYNLRRICLLLLASPQDTYVAHLRPLEEKIAELFEANPSSSPSAAIKAELFMLCRTLTLSVNALHLSPLWPIINDKMQAALMSLLPSSQHVNDFNNLSLLQAAKLLDLLIALSPDEFQLHEWLYITDTIDAVYQPADWTPSALSDQIADMLSSDNSEEDGHAAGTLSLAKRRPLLDDQLPVDKDDIKALPREEFIRAVLKPFLGQLSIHAYEGVYSLEQPDISVLRKNLLSDLLDTGSIVE